MKIKRITLETIGIAATADDLNQVIAMMDGMGWDAQLPNEGKYANRDDDDLQLQADWEADLQKCIDQLPA